MSEPVRIQLSRRKGWRMPENTVRVTRPGLFGNPFKVGQWVRPLGKLPIEIKTSQQAVDLFRWNAEHCEGGFLFRQNVRAQLRGKNLACWCALYQPCHADVLLQLANA